MDQDPQAPQNPHEGTSNPAIPPVPVPEKKDTPDVPRATAIDINKILLPKKEVHSPQSAQRINAGALLEQEQNATLKPLVEPASQKSQGYSQTFVQHVPPTASASKPKPEESTTPSLQTYRGDIEQVVQSKNVSVVSIAAAEAQRRGDVGSGLTAGTPQSIIDKTFLTRAAMIAGGVFLVVGAVGLLVFLYVRAPATVEVALGIKAPFISVDDTKTITLSQQFSRTSMMASLQAAKQNSQLSLGLVARLYVFIASTSQSELPPPISLQTLLSTLAPNAPGELLRSLDPEQYLLGVHSFDENQAFLIVQTDSYQQAFSGMLTWERSMQTELAPLFTRTPSPHVSGAVGTSTPTTTKQFAPASFIDRVVENHDARVLVNESGDMLLVWTFLDRSTIVITTNEYTLREIISRRKDLTIVPQL